MAEMALGYGSEFQLLRFLGHHRDELNKMILDKTGLHGDVIWLDYPYNSERLSGDGELKGIDCFKSLPNYSEIHTAWQKFWPQSGNSMNWDGICRIGDTWLFVEAKANEKETRQSCSAISDKSKENIDDAFSDTQTWLKSGKGKWRETDCYQLANRLAFIRFCYSQNIKAKILYIGFLNGYWKKNISLIEKWEEIWKSEYEVLGLEENAIQDHIVHIYPDCEPQK